MPTWVRGNQVYNYSSRHWRISLSTLELTHGILLGAHGSGGTNSLNFMMQPGVLRGLNVHISNNISGRDLDINFSKQVWDGGTSWAAETEFTLFTIPAGETGHFCAPKITTEVADRTWARWDKVGIKQNRTDTIGPTGVIDHWTIAVALEITEETLIDTEGLPNRATIN